MKIPAKFFKGIVYVQLSELPIIQQESILQTLHNDLFIKILIEKKVINGCLLYSDYERWYHNVYNVNSSEMSAPEIAKQIKVLANKYK